MCRPSYSFIKKFVSQHGLYTTLYLLVPSADILQTVWNQIRPDEMSGLIWIQIVWHSIGIPGRFLEKVDFEKVQQKTKKHEKISQGANS